MLALHHQNRKQEKVLAPQFSLKALIFSNRNAYHSINQDVADSTDEGNFEGFDVCIFEFKKQSSNRSFVIDSSSLTFPFFLSKKSKNQKKKNYSNMIEMKSIITLLNTFPLENGNSKFLILLTCDPFLLKIRR